MAQLTIIVKDEDDRVIPGVTVTINSETCSTNNNGICIFTGLVDNETYSIKAKKGNNIKYENKLISNGHDSVLIKLPVLVVHEEPSFLSFIDLFIQYRNTLALYPNIDSDVLNQMDSLTNELKTLSPKALDTSKVDKNRLVKIEKSLIMLKKNSLTLKKDIEKEIFITKIKAKNPNFINILRLESEAGYRDFYMNPIHFIEEFESNPNLIKKKYNLDSKLPILKIKKIINNND